MKSISNSDFSLLIEKLPIIMQLAGAQIESTDRQAANALRLLKNFHRRLLRNNPIKPNRNDKEGNH